MTSDERETTHFGFKTVPIADKAGKVAEVFTSVASRYDLMNDVMTLGTHRLVKLATVNKARARPGHNVLDLAGGTGDLAGLLAQRVGSDGQVILADINAAMLQGGRSRLEDEGKVGNINYVQADAECLPFADSSFNAVTIAFGLRNVTRQDQALAAIHQTLKPGGRLVVLEFSHPPNPVVKDLYESINRFWPTMGRMIVGDENPYTYLLESIKMHPDQETLAGMMQQAGYSKVRYENLLGGVLAIHEGQRARS
ncbi:MAG: class I SAM-dependent methyltransferase [Pseudomonadales bacterium]